MVARMVGGAQGTTGRCRYVDMGGCVGGVWVEEDVYIYIYIYIAVKTWRRGMESLHM